MADTQSTSAQARSWIDQRFGSCPTQEAFDAIADFTVLWNLFEKEHCNEDANKSNLSDVVARIDVAGGLPASLTEVLQFWKVRYQVQGGLSGGFNELFHKPENKIFVAEVLLGKRTDPAEQLYALIYIVYRLRNNLFHGPKDFYDLDNQIPNLRMAFRVLVFVFEKLP